MPIKFISWYTGGFEVVIEAEEGFLLTGGRWTAGRCSR